MIFRKLLHKVYFFLYERKYAGRLRYVFRSNNSRRLVVVFSGFPTDNKPVYNYMRTLRNKKYDKLFILDDFGYKGSYYLYENGSDYVSKLVESLIHKFLIRGGYSNVIFVGSSKGGTAAIYYGLKFKVNAIYAGACQYYIGDYLRHPEFEPIFIGMTSKRYSEEMRLSLNEIIPQQVKKSANTDSIVHLLYSKDEHTYDEHIKGLISDLNKYNIPYTERIESFVNHADVGMYFSEYLKNELY